jgi:DNA-directed RNA polymerase specialized sigma24 family protein
LSSVTACTPSNSVVDRLAVEDVMRSIKQPKHREAVLLCSHGYTNAEIAEIVGFDSDRAVEGCLYRLRAKYERTGGQREDR